MTGRYGKCHTSHTIPKRTCLRNPNFKAEFSQVLDVSRGVIARISHDFPSRWEIHRPPWLFLNFPLKQSKWGFLYYLVGGLEHEFYDFPHTVNVIIPTDFNSIIFQRGWLKPPTIYDHLCYFTLIHGLLLPLVTWNDWQFEDRRFSGSKRLTTHSLTPCRWVDRRVGDTSMVI